MTSPSENNRANTAQLRAAIDRGATGSKVPFPDPAAAPLGTDEEAAGTPPASHVVQDVIQTETSNSAAHARSGRDANAAVGASGFPKDGLPWRSLLILAAVFAAMAITMIVWR